MIGGGTIRSVVLDNTLYDKGLFNIRDLSLSHPTGIQIGINLLSIWADMDWAKA